MMVVNGMDKKGPFWIQNIYHVKSFY